MRRVFKYGHNNPLKTRFPKQVVYLLGLPGVGKTTVSNIIAKRTGFVSLEQHITYREVCHFLKKGTQAAHKLNGRLHLAIINLLLHSSIPGVVCMMSIRRQPTSQTVLNAIKLIKKIGARVHFV